MTLPHAHRPSRRTPTRPAPRPGPRLAVRRLEDRRTPALIAWDGGPGGQGTDWLTPANWAGDVLPGPGDDVTLGPTGTSPTITLTASAAVRGVTSSRAVQISGGALTLGAMTSTFSSLTLTGATVNGPGTLQVAPGSTLTAAGASTVNAPLVNNGTLVSQGDLTATGAFTSGPGSVLRMQPGGSATNAIARLPGFTNNGLIDLLAPSLGATLFVSGGPLVNAAGGTISYVGPNSDIFLLDQSALDNRGTITAAGDATVIHSTASAGSASSNSGVINVAAGGDLRIIQRPDDVFTNTGIISVAAGRTLTVIGGTLGNFSGGTLAGGTYVVEGTFNFPNAAAGSLHRLDCRLTLVGTESSVSGSENGAITTVGPAGRLELAGNRSYTTPGAFTNAGTVLVNAGSRLTAAAGLTNAAGGTLAGGGLVVAPVTSFGAVSPGSSPGVLTITGNASLRGPFAAELGGPAPGSGYDQLAVDGTVTLNGATLAAGITAPAVPAGGFVVIANDGADAVNGTFAGLPEGATTFVGGQLLRVSYAGGTGNDVVLTLPLPYPSVAGVRVNAGQADAAQRSRVTSLAVTFDQAVTFANPNDIAAAFQLSRVGGGGVGGFTAAANVVNGVTVVTISGFMGAETRFGSLADGSFRLVVLADQVSAGGQPLDGDGNGTPGGDYVLSGTLANGLFSLYGDVNGDGTVNAFDFALFRSAFGASIGVAGYRDWLDYNGDGVVNAFDFAQFRNRFGSSVP